MKRDDNISGFRVNVPSGWSIRNDNNRRVYVGPSGETLIISVAEISGCGSDAELASVRGRLMLNAESSVESAASHPDLKITRKLAVCYSDGVTECRTLHAETIDGKTLFREIIAANTRGVLIGTFEAENTDWSESVFEEIVSGLYRG